ncbi:hypothetical protein GCM10009641_36190 [Mycobacterium cookii]
MAAYALVAGHGSAGGDPGEDPGQAQELPRAHGLTLGQSLGQTARMASALTLDQAVDLTRSGDIWLFRGRRAPDRAIRAVTNSPVNHVGMAVVVDDLPPLIFHAELGKKQLDMWTGAHHRGVQLHDLREAVSRWQTDYDQDAWLRQLHPEIGQREEDGMLRAVARLDGVSFPSLTRLGARWLRGRDAYVPQRKRGRRVTPEAAFCAEIVATCYIEMGILRDDRRATWYDPGKFWSGDYLPISEGWDLGKEVAVAR